MKTALITGINGQDGSYLAELLLSKDYKVIGLERRTSQNGRSRLSHISDPNLSFIEGEVSDSGSVYSIIEEYKPDEVYNLAAQSHVGTSFEQPSYTFQVNASGPCYFLEAIRRYSPETRYYQASTSEMFGKNYSRETLNGKHLRRFQDENTEFLPQSPYAVAKLSAHHTVRIYREAYGVHASSGILFNHESERRGENFVTRKITKWLGEFIRWCNDHDVNPDQLIKPEKEDEVYIGGRVDLSQGLQFPKLRLGNLDAYRDWGHAEDYVYAMWLMLQQDNPDDYVISTGETHSVRDFLREAFNEIGIKDFEPYIIIDPKFFRPSEVDYLCGDSYKASKGLGWRPKVSFDQLVTRMVRRDLNGKEKKEFKQPV